MVHVHWCTFIEALVTSRDTLGYCRGLYIRNGVEGRVHQCKAGNLNPFAHICFQRPRGQSVCRRDWEDLVPTFVQPEGVRTTSGQVWHNPAGCHLGPPFTTILVSSPDKSKSLWTHFHMHLFLLPKAWPKPLWFPRAVWLVIQGSLGESKINSDQKPQKKPVLHQTSQGDTLMWFSRSCYLENRMQHFQYKLWDIKLSIKL